ncbi:MAG: NAD(P)/FAD-dependent oxidoreductase [Saprospiraceae bacterium]
MQQRIAIIGAGLSGLVTAKTLLEYGHDVTVFEKEPELGGVWTPSRHYPGLTTQNTRDTYAFSDFRMPKQYPEFPSGAQMLRYLTNYAEQFDVLPHIRLQHRITAANLIEVHGKSQWQLIGEYQGRPFLETADFLVVCNGTFSEPFIPAVMGMEDFRQAGGQILHTSTVGTAGALHDKKVVVVGFGKSACDVASSLAEQAASMHLVYRQAKWKVPKRILGINYKYFILSRFGEALTKLRYRTGSERLLHFLQIPGLMLGSMQRIFARQQRLQVCGLKPALPITDLVFGELSVESDGFYRQVEQGKIQAVAGEILAYEQDGIRLTKGEKIPADVVVYGTGFSQSLPFLSPDLMQQITDAQGNYLLYRHILPTRLPGLAFIGYNSSFFCNLTSEMGALWLAEYLEGQLDLPGPVAMEQQISEHLDWRKQFRQNSLYRNASVYPFNLTYVDWLMQDMRTRLPLSSLLSEWLVVVEPAHYAAVKKAVMRRSQRYVPPAKVPL